MNKHYITIDIGTGNTKVGLFRDDGLLLSLYHAKNKYYNDPKYDDATYFNTDDLADIIKEGLNKILSENPDILIDGISSTGARQSIILIDKEGKEIIGLPNIDNRGKCYLSLIENPEDIYQNTGKWVTEDFPAAKILGYKEVYEKDYSNVETFTSLSEWVGYFFTGKICIEPSQAGETQLYDIVNHKFCDELSSKYGLEQLRFPKIVNAGELLGSVTDKWSKEFPQLKDSVYIVGGADTQVALEGKDIPEDSLAIVSGTTTPIVVYSSKSIFDKKERVWVDCNLGAENYLIEVNPGSTGLNYQRFKDTFLPNYTYEYLEKEYQGISNVKVTSSLTSLRFTEKKSQKRGGFFTKAPFPDDVTAIDFAWSILGDIACSIYEQLRILEKVIGCNFEEIYGVGFGFNSVTLSQMIADLTDKTLILPGNFQHGSSYGLIFLCNKYFNISSTINDDKITFESNPKSIIHDYHKKWKKNKKRNK